jgi:hypothetical protein
MSEKLYVRLVPRNPRLGYTVAGHMYKGINFRGGERPTWYAVEPRFAEELRVFHQQHDDPSSKELFQVCSAEEKGRIERGEQEKWLAAVGAVTATVSLPRELQEPATHDLTVERVEPERKLPGSVQALPSPIAVGEATAAIASGRAAAIPPPRQPTRRATRAGSVGTVMSGAVTTADAPTGIPSRDAPDDQR